MKFIAMILVVALLTPAPAAAQYSSVVAVDPAVEGSTIAIEIPTSSGAALSGLRWFHNDGQQAFPKVVIVEGQAGLPPDLTNPGLILDEVAGVSMGWGQLTLESAVTSSTGTAFAVFFLPANEPTTALGEGGGPGIGIREELEAPNAPFWLSSDARNWAGFEATYELGVEPLYASLRGEARTIKEIGQTIELPQKAVAEEQIEYVTALGAPTPNPFNPRVQLSFTLAAATDVRLKVYDLRGRLVRTVVSGHRDRGPHAEMWNGDDHHGRRVASGVYFARFEAGKTVQVQRMVLLR